VVCAQKCAPPSRLTTACSSITTAPSLKSPGSTKSRTQAELSWFYSPERFSGYILSASVCVDDSIHARPLFIPCSPFTPPSCLISPVSTRRTFDVRFRELSRTSPPNNPHNKSPRERQRAAASLLAACPLRIRPSISTARTGTSLAGMPKIMASKLVSLRSLGRSAIPHLCVCLFG